MRQYWVYILKCSDKSYYTGVTNNLERRVAEHNVGLHPNCFTFKRRPVKVVSSSRFTWILQAIAFEKQLKGWSRAKKEALIKGEFEMLQRLSRLRRAQSDNPINSV